MAIMKLLRGGGIEGDAGRNEKKIIKFFLALFSSYCSMYQPLSTIYCYEAIKLCATIVAHMVVCIYV